MNQIHTLYVSTSLERRTNAANTIIADYDLPFDANDIIKAFDNLKNNSYDRESAHFLLVFVITNNLRLFIAIIYALCDNTLQTSWTMYMSFVSRGVAQQPSRSGVTQQPSRSGDVLDIRNLGCNWVSSDRSFNIALNIWSDLYDHYEFDISEMIFTEDLRNAIQNHIDSKRVYTKRAVK